MTILSKILRKARKLLLTGTQWLRIIAYRLLSENRITGGHLIRKQPVIATGGGTIYVDQIATIGYFPSPFFLSTYSHLEARKVDSRISIGGGTHINNNFVAIAEYTHIKIGRNCRIGFNVEILDSDFHGLKEDKRHLSLKEWAKPVEISDNVFIGSNVKILKGSSIGEGSVIANSSVVVGPIPSGVIAGGNPCRVIRSIE